MPCGVGDVAEQNDTGDWKPRPDPTVLTTEALHREIASLHAIFEGKLTVLNELVNVHVAHLREQIDHIHEISQTAIAEREKACGVAAGEVKTFYDTVLSERDARYDERFACQEKAVVVALATVNREFHEHLAQVREETRLALDSADKAISKSEAATEKRFNSVNEFRAQQADIIQTFARKDEINQRLSGLSEKIDTLQNLASTALPRTEYDRAHTDLAERVIQVEKAITEKLEVQTKALENRIALLQSQLANIEAITR